MFSTSTQLKFWTISTENPEIIERIRETAHKEYRTNHAHSFNKDALDESFFLSYQEERLIVSVYEQKMMEFCKNFHPPLPLNVIGTAFHYYKRFYLNNSVMNYHPKDIYPSCAFLSCKIEEYNLTIDEFVMNFDPVYRPKMVEIIINNELLIMTAIKFHLTIHNPYRPARGLLIDIEMKCPDLIESQKNSLLQPIVEFIDKSYFTDVLFFYSPSQIALAAIIQVSGKKGLCIDSYIASELIGEDKLPIVIDAVKGIRRNVNKFKFKVVPEDIKRIESKLEKCRNPENNIDSNSYRKPMSELEEEELIDEGW